MRLEKLNPSVKAFTILLSVIILSFQYIICKLQYKNDKKFRNKNVVI